jgi:hypothetical protein
MIYFNILCEIRCLFLLSGKLCFIRIRVARIFRKRSWAGEAAVNVAKMPEPSAAVGGFFAEKIRSIHNRVPGDE